MKYWLLLLIMSVGGCNLPPERTVQIELVKNNLLTLNSHLWVESIFLITNSTDSNLYLPVNESSYVEYGYSEIEFCDNQEGEVTFRDYRNVKYQTIKTNTSGLFTLFRKRDIRFDKYIVTDSTGIKLELLISDSCSQ